MDKKEKLLKIKRECVVLIILNTLLISCMALFFIISMLKVKEQNTSLVVVLCISHLISFGTLSITLGYCIKTLHRTNKELKNLNI